MKKLAWDIEVTVVGAVVVYIALRPIPFLFYQELPYVNFLSRVIYMSILCCFFCIS